MSRKRPKIKKDCTIPPPALPAEALSEFSIDRDIHSEQDIARYVEKEANEKVKHAERVKKEAVVGIIHEVWDVTTNKSRWWVITNLTNLYPQKLFPSLDYTLSFHVGLMMRMRSRPNGADSEDPTPFDEVFRRQEQAKARYETALEAEDFQAVGMQLRECLISLIAALRRRVQIPAESQRPQDANVVDWTDLIMDQLCPGESNKELRQHLKHLAKDTWQIVNWLTHARNATKTAASISIHSCDTVVGHFIQFLEREKVDKTERCPLCRSREIRSHFNPSLGSDGDYYLSCGKCGWTSVKGPNIG